MRKYYCGIKLLKDRYAAAVIDDNLNILFADILQAEGLIEMLRKKDISIISIDAPAALYIKYHNLQSDAGKVISLRRRSFENIISNKNLFTYRDRFNITPEKLVSVQALVNSLNKLGFSIREAGNTNKALIESYPDTSFLALGFLPDKGPGCPYISDQKEKYLRNKGIRMDYAFKGTKTISGNTIDSICQAYTSYMYDTGNASCIGSPGEGVLVIPVREIFKEHQANTIKRNSFPTVKKKEPKAPACSFRESDVITEYCGAQYLYTNTDGIIRVDELRPIKSYKPFIEIYQMKYIKLVQVTIGTTDGLNRVKATFIPSDSSYKSFKVANDEDRKMLDHFLGIHGGNRGYLIKFNKVEVVKNANI